MVGVGRWSGVEGACLLGTVWCAWLCRTGSFVPFPSLPCPRHFASTSLLSVSGLPCFGLRFAHTTFLFCFWGLCFLRFVLSQASPFLFSRLSYLFLLLVFRVMVMLCFVFGSSLLTSCLGGLHLLYSHCSATISACCISLFSIILLL